jgi:hypothetical protein
MKTNYEVSLNFAEGKTANGNHMHTNGRDIYSYSTMIAQKQESGIILLNSRDYSPTTRRHKLHILRACKGLTVYEVRRIERPTTTEHAQNLAELQNIAEDWRRKANKARKEETRKYYTERAEEANTTANNYYFDFCL